MAKLTPGLSEADFKELGLCFLDVAIDENPEIAASELIMFGAWIGRGKK
jgi:hypothetical protein